MGGAQSNHMQGAVRRNVPYFLLAVMPLLTLITALVHGEGMHDQLTTVYDDLPADRVQHQTQIEDAKNWASQAAELVASTDRVQDQTHTINDRKDHTQIKDGTNQASNAAELIGDALRESAKQSSTRRKKSKGSRRRRAKQRKKSKCKSKPQHRRRHWRCTPQRECKVRFYYDARTGAKSITTPGACNFRRRMQSLGIAEMIRRRRIKSKGSTAQNPNQYSMQTVRRRTCSCLKRRRSRSGRCKNRDCTECSRCRDRTCSHRGAIRPAARNPNCTTPRVNGGSSQMLGEDSSTPTPDFLAGYQAAKGATVRPTTPRRVNQVQKAGCVCNPAKCDDPNCDGVTPNGAGKILPRLLCKKVCPSPRCDGNNPKRCDFVQEEGRCIADSAFGKQWSSLMDLTYPHYKQKMEWKQSEVFGQQVIHA